MSIEHARSLASDEELAALDDPDTSPEERAALDATDDTPENAASTGTPADDTPPADDDDAPPPAGDTPPADTPPADTPPADAPPADAAPVQQPTGFKAELPENYQERVDALKAKGGELAQKFRDGDITFDEYEAERTALDAERDDLNAARLRVDMYQDMNQQTAAQQWARAIDTFKSDVLKGDGIDYNTDAARGTDLDMFVKALAERADNADKGMRWFLDEAHKRVLALHGKPEAKPAAAGKPADPAGKPPADVAAARKPDASKQVQTLADVPGGEGAGDVGGEFASLDSLSGDELEAAMAKMTQAQRERYLAS